MKRISLLVAGCLCLSIAVLAGQVITNDTGESATGLRVVFSSPVLITAFGDILTSVDQTALSYEFVFSGGTVKPWESQWFNYAPATASVVTTEWLAPLSETGKTTLPGEGSSPMAGRLWGSNPDDLDFRYVAIGQLWMDIFLDFPTNYREKIMEVLSDIKALGFKGASVNITYFIDTVDHEVFAAYDPENDYHAWRYSPEDWMIEVLFECIRDSGLDGDLRIGVDVPNIEYGMESRFHYSPPRAQAEKFLRSYKDLAIRLAEILERTNADVFTLFQEMTLPEEHGDLIWEMLDAVAAVFSGELLIEQHAYNVLWKLFPEIRTSGDTRAYAEYCGTFWDWEHADGRKLIIGYSWWHTTEPGTYSAYENLGIEYSSDIEFMINEIVQVWGSLVQYHRSRYPGHKIVYSEVGIYNFGNQEMANLWQAYLTAMQQLAVDGFAVWGMDIAWEASGFSGLRFAHEWINGEPVISVIQRFLE